MKLKFVFSFLLLVGTALAADEIPEKRKTTTTTTTPAPTTPSTPPTTPSTEPPTTTPAPTTPTPTTPAPTTSTPTTPVPTSTPTTAASTTPNPTSAPTTPAPEPPKPEKWKVNYPNSNISCIMAMMDIEFDIHGNFTPVPAVIKIDPSNAKAEGGTCEGSPQVLRVAWKNSNNDTNFIALSFEKKNEEYHVSGMNASLSYSTTKGFLFSNFTDANITLFKTNVNTSYHCSTYETSSKNKQNETLTVKLTKIYLEAFRKSNSTDFSSSHMCAGDIPDIVPLVVGIALAGLVLVVVIAYLIGRRRSQARGYLSM